MKLSFRDYPFLLLVAGSIVALDQWTKSIVRANLPLGSTWLPEGWEWLSPYARILHWYNTGAAFGLFKNGAILFSILAIVISVLIIIYFPRIEAGNWWLRVAMSMQLGGAVGNLISRVTMSGRVTDFISLGTFPVFNVADSSITIGTIILLLGMWLKERQLKRDQVTQAQNRGANNGGKESE